MKFPIIIRKRNGICVDFDPVKIRNAIAKAITAVGEERTCDPEKLTVRGIEKLSCRFSEKDVPTVEEIQDIVEETLIEAGHTGVAKAYILYRDQHMRLRETEAIVLDGVKLVEDYLERSDWRVKENSNMTYSLQGLNFYLASYISARYWLNKIYPPEVRERHIEGAMHIHDLGMLAAYCCGWDLHDLLIRGFGGVGGKVCSKPPRHLRSALGQIVNFFYTLQGETAGAQAFSNFDTLLAPFVYYDKLSYDQVKQAIQEFIFNTNVPTRVGFQTPFTNLTMDLVCPRHLNEEPVIVGGELQEGRYGDFQSEMDMINRAFAELMLEGDAQRRAFTFPIPTYNITDDFDWDNPNLIPMWKMSGKYGIPYFANFINSSLKPEDARSMCCRLRLDNRELRRGGLFAANPLTGSIGVVTINIPRIAYASNTADEFFENLSRTMEYAKVSLEIKRKVLERYTENGLYPYSRHYLVSIKSKLGDYWGNHFSTIGLNGVNEGCINFLGVDIGHPEGKAFAVEILRFMRRKCSEYQDETDHLYNLEATPAESVCYRLAKEDRRRFPDIHTAGTETEPYYTNSSHLPVSYTDDLFKALSHQEILQQSYTGGTVFHGFVGERISDWRQVRLLVRKIAENFQLPYFTITPTFSICPVHGYISGEHRYCPYDHSEAELERFGVEAS